MDGANVRIPGFIVPLEFNEDQTVTQFFLVPYFGACIHTPPPPPNQIVYIKMDEAVEVNNIWDPYWIIGTIETKPYMGEVADTVYQLSGQRVEKYEY